jgi:hypothetical protein
MGDPESRGKYDREFTEGAGHGCQSSGLTITRLTGDYSILQALYYFKLQQGKIQPLPEIR